MISKQLIVPLYAYSNKLKAIYLGEKYNYNNISIVNSGDPEDKNIIYNIPQTLDKHLKVNVCEIQKFTDNNALYIINTINSNDPTDTDIEIKYHMSGDSNKDYMEKLISNIGFDPSIKPYLNVVQKANNTDSPILTVYNLYIDTINSELENDSNKKIAYANILKGVIDSINYANIKSDQYYSYNIDTINNTITVDTDIKKIVGIDYSTENNNTIPDVYDISINNKTIKLKEHKNKVYAYILYDCDNNIRKVLFIFYPDQEIKSLWWNNKQEAMDKYNKMIQKTYDYPSSYLSFTEEELKILAIIKELIPKQPLVRYPIAYYNNGNVYVEINNTDDYDLLKAFNKPFYISFREPELALDKNDCRRIKIEEQSFKFNAKSLDIYDEEYLVWIEDENFNIISTIGLVDLSRIFARDDYDYDDTSEIQFSTTEFEEKIRQLELYEYSKHFWPYVKAYCPENEDELRRLYKEIEDSQYIGQTNIADVLSDACCISENTRNIPMMIKTIMEDNTVYGNYELEFLNGAIKYYYKENRVVVQPKENCLYIFDSYITDKIKTRIYKMADEKETKSHIFNDTHYGVVWAYDTVNYKRTGFVLIDFTKGKLEPRTYKYLVEEMDVIH